MIGEVEMMLVLGILILIVGVQAFARDGQVEAPMATRMSAPPMKVARAGSSAKTAQASTGWMGTSRLLIKAASLEGRNFEPSLNRTEAMEKTSPKTAKIRISPGEVANGLPK